MHNIKLKILRRDEVLNRFGFKRSTLSNRINQKLCVPPINLGDRAVGFFEHEINAILAALSIGESPESIRELVDQLVNSRMNLKKEILSQISTSPGEQK